MSPDSESATTLLYVSRTTEATSVPGLIDVFSVPNYSLVGQITDGIDKPQGLAVDKDGNLYVANLHGKSITVYKPGQTIPSLKLAQPDNPDAVAVGSNGYVYAADVDGGIDVYPPGATSPIRRLTNDAIANAGGVAVSSSNDVYAAGVGNSYSPAVVEFAKATGSGKNLGLTGLYGDLEGVILDGDNLIVSDFSLGAVLTYALGKTSPSSTIKAFSAEHSAINEAGNEIYVPEHKSDRVGVYDYPSGTLVTTILIGGFANGAALSPAATTNNAVSHAP
jgi:hypothetical protein